MSNLVKHVQTVAPRNTAGAVADIYAQSRRELGRLVEPVTMFSSDPALLVASWVTFREAVLAQGRATRAAKEAVAATVSQLNDCTFCVDAHTIMLYGAGEGDFASRLLDRKPGTAKDPQLRALAQWTERMTRRPASPSSSALAAPFSAEQAPEILGTMVHFHFLNRVLNVLVGRTFLPGFRIAHGIARRVAGKVVFSRFVRQTIDGGGAVGLQTGNPLPADLQWTAPEPHIAHAFATLAHISDEAAAGSVPASVQQLVRQVVGRWSGESPGLGTAWASEATASLPAKDRPAGRLALLTALASTQTTAQDIAAYRENRPGDPELLGLLTWSAFTAAREIGRWSVPAVN